MNPRAYTVRFPDVKSLAASLYTVLRDGKPALFSQSGAHLTLRSSAITGRTEYDGQPHISIFYQLDDQDNPNLQEFALYLQLIQLAIKQNTNGRITFRDGLGNETTDPADAVEVEIAISEEITRHSPIHQRSGHAPGKCSSDIPRFRNWTVCVNPDCIGQAPRGI
jgi:hypothetical protein